MELTILPLTIKFNVNLYFYPFEDNVKISELHLIRKYLNSKYLNSI